MDTQKIETYHLKLNTTTQHNGAFSSNYTAKKFKSTLRNHPTTNRINTKLTENLGFNQPRSQSVNRGAIIPSENKFTSDFVLQGRPHLDSNQNTMSGKQIVQ